MALTEQLTSWWWMLLSKKRPAEDPPGAAVATDAIASGKDMPIGACVPLKDYEQICRVGEGTFGLVYKARHRRTGEIVALKKVILHYEKDDGFPTTSLRELRVLKMLHHPNIVQIHDVAVGKERDSVHLVFEYCDNDLACILEAMSRPFLESETKCLMLQLLDAVAYMHDHWVIHRDLKMSNLLYKSGELRVADFGLARTYGYPDPKFTPKVVTLWYRAPELLLGAPTYDVSLDMWAVGCIFGELLLKAPLLPGRTELEQLTKIVSLIGPPSEIDWPAFPTLSGAAALIDALPSLPRFSALRSTFPALSENGLDLLDGLLTYDPAKRLTAKEAARHPWFREYPYPKPVSEMPPCPTVEPTGMGQQLRRTIPAVAPVAAPAQRTGSGAVIGKIKHIRPKITLG